MEINLRLLDCLRGLLAVYVLAFHARWLLWCGNAVWWSEPHPAWANALALLSAGLRFPHEAVMVFFCLSGFFIHFRAARKFAEGKPAQMQILDYAGRRLHRLAPAYYFALLITVAADAMGHVIWPDLYLGRTPDALLNVNMEKGGYSPASLPALVLLPGLLGPEWGSNGPLWSLTFEVLYYAIYPLWLALRSRFGAGVYLVIPLLLALPAGWWETLPGALLGHYSIWLIGAALVEFVMRRQVRLWHLCLAAMFAAGGVGLRLIVVARWTEVGSNILVAGCFVLLFATAKVDVGRLAALRFAERLGIASYSIYIIHFPLLVVGCAWLFRVWGERPSSGLYAVAGGILVLGISYGCFLLVERRFLHRRLAQ